MIDLVLIGEGIALFKIIKYAQLSNAYEVKYVFSDSQKKNQNFDDIEIFPSAEIYNPLTFILLNNSVAENSWLLSVNNSEHLIPPDILSLFKDRNLNAHIGLLPQYAGRFGHQWAIMNGEAKTGVTLHQMNTIFDSGKIFSREEILIGERDTGMSILTRCFVLVSKMVEEFLDNLAKGLQITPIDQKQFGNRKAYKVSDMPDGKLNWRLKSFQLYNFIRAANYYPFKSPNYSPYLEDKNMNKIYISKVYPPLSNKSNLRGMPGLVISTNPSFSILCGDSKCLRLEILSESENNQNVSNLYVGDVLP